MVAFDVAQLAQDGAASLISAMATDFWTTTRSRVARIFGREPGKDDNTTLKQLEEIRSALLANPDPEMVADIRAELRGFLKAYLIDNSDSIPLFASLLDEIRRELDKGHQIVARQQAFADRGSTVMQAGRDIVSAPRRQ